MGLAFVTCFFIQYLVDPAVGFLVIMVFIAVGMSSVMTLLNAVYGDVMAQEERETGKRREGVFTGFRVLCVDLAGGVANFLVVPVLSIGNTQEDPLGIMLVPLIAGGVV